MRNRGHDTGTLVPDVIDTQGADRYSEWMRLIEIVKPECIKVPLVATAKQGVIYELVDLLADVERIAARQELREAVWKRELTRTTGIGHGIAIPHGKIAGCDHLCMALGTTAEPIDFGAIDHKPVKLVILLASPIDQTGPHIQALAQISRILTDDEFRAAVLRAATGSEIHELIGEQEAKTPV